MISSENMLKSVETLNFDLWTFCCQLTVALWHYHYCNCIFSLCVCVYTAELQSLRQRRRHRRSQLTNDVTADSSHSRRLVDDVDLMMSLAESKDSLSSVNSRSKFPASATAAAAAATTSDSAAVMWVYTVLSQRVKEVHNKVHFAVCIFTFVLGTSDLSTIND